MLHRLTAPSALVALIARHTAIVDENQFVDWLVDAKPGEHIVYYRGHLAYDRTPAANVLDTPSRALVHAVAGRVLKATANGLVLPVQKRIGTGDYLYIAVKASPGRVASRCGAAAPQLAISKAPAFDPPTTVPAALAA